MNVKPILFNTEMTQAILEGRKTQTRRIVKKKYDNTQLKIRTDKYGTRLVEAEILTEQHRIKNPDGTTTLKLRYFEDKNPPYKRGDILWVREPWSTHYDGIHPDLAYCYKANEISLKAECAPGETKRWYPSVHMPREAARLFLKVKDVRVERLQDMDEDAAIAEGIADSPAGTASPLLHFSVLWDKTIKREDLREFGYHANPWVWVIEFERCEKPEGWD